MFSKKIEKVTTVSEAIAPLTKMIQDLNEVSDYSAVKIIEYADEIERIELCEKVARDERKLAHIFIDGLRSLSGITGEENASN